MVKNPNSTPNSTPNLAPFTKYVAELKNLEKEIMEKEFKKKEDKIEVSHEDFLALVKFIENEGFVVIENGVLSDHQYTFLDKQGNRHALMTIKRNEDGRPDVDGTINQISVWFRYKGSNDSKHNFLYIIKKDEGITLDDDNTINCLKQKRKAVRIGFNEFLTKVKTTNSNSKQPD